MVPHGFGQHPKFHVAGCIAGGIGKGSLIGAGKRLHVLGMDPVKPGFPLIREILFTVKSDKGAKSRAPFHRSNFSGFIVGGCPGAGFQCFMQGVHGLKSLVGGFKSLVSLPLQFSTLFFCGYIKKYAKTAVRGTIWITGHLSCGAEPPISPVFGIQAVFAVIGSFPCRILYGCLDAAIADGIIFRMQQISPGIQNIREIFYICVAHHFAEFVAPLYSVDLPVLVAVHSPHTGFDQAVNGSVIFFRIFGGCIIIL